MNVCFSSCSQPPASCVACLLTIFFRSYQEERKRVQALYVKEAALKRKEKELATKELTAKQKEMEAERQARAAAYRQEAEAKKAAKEGAGSSNGTSTPNGSSDVAGKPAANGSGSKPSSRVPDGFSEADLARLEAERVQRSEQYRAEAAERKKAAEEASRQRSLAGEKQKKEEERQRTEAEKRAQEERGRQQQRVKEQEAARAAADAQRVAAEKARKRADEAEALAARKRMEDLQRRQQEAAEERRRMASAGASARTHSQGAHWADFRTGTGAGTAQPGSSTCRGGDTSGSGRGWADYSRAGTGAAQPDTNQRGAPGRQQDATCTGNTGGTWWQQQGNFSSTQDERMKKAWEDAYKAREEQKARAQRQWQQEQQRQQEQQHHQQRSNFAGANAGYANGNGYRPGSAYAGYANAGGANGSSGNSSYRSSNTYAGPGGGYRSSGASNGYTGGGNGYTGGSHDNYRGAGANGYSRPASAAASAGFGGAGVAAQDSAWAKLDASKGEIRYNDVPWPPSTDRPLPLGLAGGKKAMKKYVLRWHPDKFQQKYGPRLAASDRDRILDKVKAVSQAVNAQWAQLK